MESSAEELRIGVLTPTLGPAVPRPSCIRLDGTDVSTERGRWAVARPDARALREWDGHILEAEIWASALLGIFYKLAPSYLTRWRLPGDGPSPPAEDSTDQGEESPGQGDPGPRANRPGQRGLGSVEFDDEEHEPNDAEHTDQAGQPS